MSSWTTLSRQVLDARYKKTSGWFGSAKPEDTYATNIILEARRNLTLYPGSVVNDEGRFADRTTSAMPKDVAGNPVPGSFFEGFAWRGIPQEFGGTALQVTKSNMTENTAWFRQDWNVQILLNQGLDASYADYLQTAKRIWIKALQTLDWVPPAVAVKLASIMDMGFLPIMVGTQGMSTVGRYTPKWLNTPGRRAAWDAIQKQFHELNKAVTKSTLYRLKAEATKAEQSAAFWNGVAKWTGVDAIESKWAELRTKIGEFNKNKEMVDDSAKRIDVMIATTPGAFSAETLDTVEKLKVSAANTTQQAKAALQGPVMSALTDDGMGLGIAPIIIVGLGAATIAGAVTTIISYTAIMEKTRRQIMAQEAEMLKQQTAFNQAQLATDNAAIIERQAQLDSLLDQGKISPDSHARQTDDLVKRKQVAAQDYTERQNLNKQLATQFNDNAKTAPESSTVQMLGQLKWMGLAAAAIVGVIFIAPRVAKKKG